MCETNEFGSSKKFWPKKTNVCWSQCILLLVNGEGEWWITMENECLSFFFLSWTHFPTTKQWVSFHALSFQDISFLKLDMVLNVWQDKTLPKWCMLPHRLVRLPLALWLSSMWVTHQAIFTIDLVNVSQGVVKLTIIGVEIAFSLLVVLIYLIRPSSEKVLYKKRFFFQTTYWLCLY